MTETEARRAGLLPPRKARTTRKTEPRGGAESRCCTCGDTFTTDARETSHVEGTGHARYESSVGAI